MSDGQIKTGGGIVDIKTSGGIIERMRVQAQYLQNVPVNMKEEDLRNYFKALDNALEVNQQSPEPIPDENFTLAGKNRAKEEIPGWREYMNLSTETETSPLSDEHVEKIMDKYRKSMDKYKKSSNPNTHTSESNSISSEGLAPKNEIEDSVYVYVPWPRSQDLHNFRWFRSECILMNDKSFIVSLGCAGYFVPEHRYKEYLKSKS